MEDCIYTHIIYMYIFGMTTSDKSIFKIIYIH